MDTVCHVFFGTCESTLPPWSIDVPGGKPDVVPPVIGVSFDRENLCQGGQIEARENGLNHSQIMPKQPQFNIY